MKKLLLGLILLSSIVAQAQTDHFDSLFFNKQTGWAYPRKLFITGMSIAFGVPGPTYPDSTWHIRFGRRLGDSTINVAQGGSGAIDNVMQAYLYITVPHKFMIMSMGSRNQYTASAVGSATYNTVLNSLKAEWVVCNLRDWVKASTSPFVTKYSASSGWTTYAKQAINGYSEVFSLQGIQTSTNGDSIVFVTPFANTSVAFTILGRATGGTTFDWYIDGVLQQTGVSTNGTNDGINTKNININRSGTAIVPMSFFKTGLTNGVHTVKLVNTSAGNLIVDYFGTLVSTNHAYPFIFIHDYAYGSTGSSGGSNDTLVHSNWKTDSLKDAIQNNAPNYPMDTFPTNRFTNSATDNYSDGIHINDTGTRHVDSGLNIIIGPRYFNPGFRGVYAVADQLLMGVNGNRNGQVYNTFNVRPIAQLGDFTDQYLPLAWASLQTLTTNGFNLVGTGPGANTGNGQLGSKLWWPGFGCYDSARCGINFQPGFSPGASINQDIKLIAVSDGRLLIGGNISTIGSIVDATHGGFSQLMDFRNTGTTDNPVMLWNVHVAGGGVINALRAWGTSTTTAQIQASDSAHAFPGLIPFGVSGSLAISIPRGPDGSRPGTNQNGYIRFNTQRLQYEGFDAVRNQYSQWALDNGHGKFTPTTGQTVTLANNQFNVINPAGTIAALTITFPASPQDNDHVRIKFTQAVTTITWTGGTPPAAPTTAAVGTYLELTYDAASTTWF